MDAETKPPEPKPPSSKPPSSKPSGAKRKGIPWRELAGEIGTIVAGVVIALAAGQAVDALQWRHTVQVAEDAIILELGEDNGPQGYERMAINGCLDHQLDAIQAAIDNSRPASEVYALARSYHPPYRTWDQEAWNAMVSSNAASHVPPSRMILWSEPYRAMPTLNELNAQELETGATLRATRRHPGPLSEDEAERFVVAIQRLRELNRALYVGGRVLIAATRDAGVTVPAKDKADMLADVRRRYGACVAEPPADSTLSQSDEDGA